LAFTVARDLAKGQIHPCAVPVCNMLHGFFGLCLLGVIALLWLGAPWLVSTQVHLDRMPDVDHLLQVDRMRDARHPVSGV
jgi:hypothetical protein